MEHGKIFLIPTVIADGTQQVVIPKQVVEILPSISYFLVENVRTARRYLSSLKVFESIEPLIFEVLDKDTREEHLRDLFAPVFAGKSMGILSESGCPGIADPGALAVAFAHKSGVSVVPLVGPSSLVLALMASGLNGQRFAFHGYLPIEQGKLSKELKELERESRLRSQTQLFIETPYRNNSMMNALLSSLNGDTYLTVALDLTGPDESVRTLKVKEWKTLRPEFPKLPAVFLFLA
jgi:16S rRNA (cytidine1402-2'-O)-methyltransferase